MTIEEVREQIARDIACYVECGEVGANAIPVREDREFADRILAAIAGLFTDEHMQALREANFEAVHSYNFPLEMRRNLFELADTLSTLRTYATPQESKP